MEEWFNFYYVVGFVCWCVCVLRNRLCDFCNNTKLLKMAQVPLAETTCLSWLKRPTQVSSWKQWLICAAGILARLGHCPSCLLCFSEEPRTTDQICDGVISVTLGTWFMGVGWKGRIDKVIFHFLFKLYF